MIRRVNLHLLKEHLIQLNDTSYFSKNIKNYIYDLIQVIDHVLSAKSCYQDSVCRQLQDLIWASSKYLSGSVSRETPYEVGFALQAAVKDWVVSETTIITALVEDQNYHFAPMDPWQFIATTITGFGKPTFEGKLIHVALPRLYKNKPIYCIPLYHELGHYIDISNKISERCVMRSGQISRSILNHIREYFADIFAASYCGGAISSTLLEIAGGAPSTETHPATADRVAVLDAFLSAQTHPLIDEFNTILNDLRMPSLTIRFRVPEITAAFDKILPYRVNSIDEIHGLFSAGLSFLHDALERNREPWASLNEFEIERIINDLVEKSVRSFAVRERWTDATSRKE